MIKNFGIILILAVLTGCSVSGPKYSQYQLTVKPVQEESSRVFFFRNSRFMSGGVDAEIHINGTKVGECANDAYFFTDVPAGLAKIKADNSYSPGEHIIERNLEQGSEYYFEVLVNEAYVHSGVIVGAIGQAAYVSGNENSSGWIFNEVSKEVAVPQLKDKPFSLDGE